ncbi:hypothetical protein N7528_009930 [Penicillium herquei]|uniref:Uncharacterized protein n=1 Tax=Penicillium malachiteum TaxID=1324776 RepID=A0AAD6HCE4_9EURO|nr:hypothetical protein N7528_009930 [Penicillium herquei]KAJ5708888.1 hypothetical protein N7493_010222 [Penicillium malachiteum]
MSLPDSMFEKNSNSSSASSSRIKKPDLPLPDPALKWGITPTKPLDPNEKPGPDHPVHQIPTEEQERMREKGINPVLKAEMDQVCKGEGSFWQKVRQTSMGGGWTR